VNPSAFLEAELASSMQTVIGAVRIDGDFTPPCSLVTLAVKLTVMDATERDRELVTDPAPERAQEHRSENRSWQTAVATKCSPACASMNATPAASNPPSFFQEIKNYPPHRHHQ
jgi:hypothetical protein